MKEQFVTYEIALAMKELGFDEHCLTHYMKDIGKDSYSLQAIIKTTYMNFDAADRTDDPEHYKGYKNSIKQRYGDETIAAPLWQQVIDWFLTEKNISIHVGALFISNITNPFWKVTMKIDSHISEKTYGGFSDTTLKGKEIAILKCIELCKQKK